MSDWKERLKGSQAAGADYPKLEISKKYEAAENNNQPCFKSWNKDLGEHGDNEYYTTPLQGILIGQCMKLSCYSDDLGSKGGNYFSDYYYNNQNVTVFENTKNGIKKVVSGNMEQCEAWLVQNSTSKKLSKKTVLFLATTKGLIEVQTNLVIGIDQLKNIKGKTTDYMIKLIPSLYNKANEDISKKAKDILGKFSDKNPPKYARIALGKEITEADFNAVNGEKQIEDYTKWRDYKLKGIAQPEGSADVSQEPKKEDFNQERKPYNNPNLRDQTNDPVYRTSATEPPEDFHAPVKDEAEELPF